MTTVLNTVSYFFSVSGLIFILTACCYQSESWQPWNECTDQNIFITIGSCRATQAFLCLSIIFIWIGMMTEKIVNTDKNEVRHYLWIGVCYFLGGVFMFIAMGIFTGSLNKYHHDSNVGIEWSSTWALGWAGASFEVFSGLLTISFYSLVD